ncbi:MAG: hypothetical protein HY508_02140 [Acidobacteria bacterium]|nr:hypothetical protein [Acidobacteriota bacterium]
MNLSEVLRLVTAGLDQLQIRYMIVGSFASSAYGSIRTTQDADLIVDLPLEKAQGLVEKFRNEFYVDLAQVEQAVKGQHSFNIIHLGSFFKVDFFILADKPHMREEFSRRIVSRLDASGEASVWLATAEDTLLSKLHWYRSGGEVSELQWRDAVGILKIQSGRLDMTYLERGARELGVFDLLTRALGKAALPQK